MRLWNDKPYHSLDYELKKRFGEKVYRLTLNGGMTCPNRDGTVGHGGCIFCSGGGSGDFARNGALSCFFCHSVAKGGAISAVVPMCSHVDHTEHDTHVFISEQGVADVRGLSPKERAKVIINNVAHPTFRDQLMDYFERACALNGNSQTPHILSEAFKFHTSLAETGSMLFKK